MAALRLLLAADRLGARRAARARDVLAGGDALLLGTLLVLHLVATTFATLMVWIVLHSYDRSGEPVALLVWRSSLLVDVAAWLLLPILTAGLSVRRTRVPPSRLLCFPLRVRTLFGYALGSTLLRRPYLILLATTLVALAPAAWLPRPVPALAAAALFLLVVVPGASAVSLALDAALTAPRGRALAVGLGSVLMLSLLLSPLLPVRPTGNGLEIVTRWGNVLLASRDGERGVFPVVAEIAPGSRVIEAGLPGAGARALAHLSLLALVVLAASGLAFRRALLEPPRLSARPRGAILRRLTRVPGLRDPLAALVEKELCLLWQTVDAPLLVLAGLAGAAVALLGSRDAATGAAALLPLGVLLVAAMPFNAFGLDRAGVDRYRLVPVSGRDVVLSKNVAFLAVALVAAAPLLVALAVRLGVRLAACAALLHLGYLFGCLAWGNVVGLESPAPREAWNFDSQRQAGGLVSVVLGGFGAAGVTVVGAAALWADAHLGTGGLALPGVAVLGLLAGLAAWRLGLGSAGRDFEERALPMRESLAR